MSSNPAQIPHVTVGDLITELCRLPDHAAITFRSPGTNSELRLLRIVAPSKTTVEIEFQHDVEPVTVVPADASPTGTWRHPGDCFAKAQPEKDHGPRTLRHRG